MTRPRHDDGTTWTSLTNHAYVLLVLAREPDIRLRELVVRVGISERATQRIVAELEHADDVAVRRVGQRNEYSVKRDRPPRHPTERRHCVGELLRVVAAETTS